jgi:hypothetical protein
MQDINNEVNELSQLLVESDLWGNMLVISHTKLPNYIILKVIDLVIQKYLHL